MSHKKGNDKIGRNDPCPCGSGQKYKKCCMGSNASFENENLQTSYFRKYNIRVKQDKDIKGITNAGILALQTLDLVEQKIQPGIKTDTINTLVHEFTLDHHAVSAPLGYRGFPKSVCISINDVICHGIPGGRELQDGDIVNIDVTPILNGYYADVSKTFFVGTPSADAKKIVQVARKSLKKGLSVVKPGNTVGDIGWAIQKFAESKGCSVVRDFVGHGVGYDFHEPPQIPHYGRKGTGLRLIPGMVFTVEPMINLGGYALRVLEDNWTAVTLDGSLSAQFEQTILVTDDGYKSLTPFEL